MLYFALGLVLSAIVGMVLDFLGVAPGIGGFANLLLLWAIVISVVKAITSGTDRHRRHRLAHRH